MTQGEGYVNLLGSLLGTSLYVVRRAYYHLATFWEGLHLVFKYKYVLRIMAVSCLYEIVVTVLDYEFKVIGAGVLEPSRDAQSNAGESFKFANLMGRFGQLTNLLTLLVSLFGYSFVVKHFGVKVSLLVYPVLLLVAVIICNLAPTLWVLFFIVSILKAMSYSFNEPVKELLYQPTSLAIKYKAKAWIDVFGTRLAKAVGSSISYMAHGSVTKLQIISELPSFAVSVALLVFAWQTGSQFESYVAQGIVVGDGPDVSAESEKHRRSGSGTSTSSSSSRSSSSSSSGTRGDPVDARGLRPGDVGYSGYDPELFEGVLDDNGDFIALKRSSKSGPNSNSSNSKSAAVGIEMSGVASSRPRRLDNEVFRAAVPPRGAGTERAVTNASLDNAATIAVASDISSLSK
jgi:hypothetical protein